MENNSTQFNAIKVDVSTISKRYDSKVAVVTNTTTVASIVSDLLRKLRLKDAQLGDFVFEAMAEHEATPGGLEHLQYDDNDCPLDTYNTYPKGAVRFILRNKNGTNLNSKNDNRVNGNMKNHQRHDSSTDTPASIEPDLIRFDSPDVKPKPVRIGSKPTSAGSKAGSKPTSAGSRAGSKPTSAGSSNGSSYVVHDSGRAFPPDSPKLSSSRGAGVSPGDMSNPGSNRSTPRLSGGSTHQHTLERMRKGLEKLRRKPSDTGSVSSVSSKPPAVPSHKLSGAKNIDRPASAGAKRSSDLDGKLDKPVHFVDRQSLEYLKQQQQQQQQVLEQQQQQYVPHPRGYRRSPARSLQQQGVLLPEASKPPVFKGAEDDGRTAHKVHHPQALRIPHAAMPNETAADAQPPQRTSTQASSPLSPVSSTAHSDGYVSKKDQRGNDGAGFTMRRTNSMSLPQMKDAYTPPFMSESFELPKSRSLQSLSGSSGVTRRRSLPPLNVSKEHLEEKKSSLSNRLAKKINKYRQEGHKAILPNTFSSQTLQFLKDFNQFNRSMGKSDPDAEEAVSLTSLEVANILDGKPAYPTNEDVEEYLQCVESDPGDKSKSSVKKSSSFHGQTSYDIHQQSLPTNKPVHKPHAVPPSAVKTQGGYMQGGGSQHHSNEMVEIVYDDDPPPAYSKPVPQPKTSHPVLGTSYQKHRNKPNAKLNTYVDQSMKSFFHDGAMSHDFYSDKNASTLLTAVDIPLEGSGGDSSGYATHSQNVSYGANKSDSGKIMPIRPQPTYANTKRLSMQEEVNHEYSNEKNNNNLHMDTNGYVDRRHSTSSYDRMKKKHEQQNSIKSPSNPHSPSNSDALLQKPLSLFHILQSHNTVTVYLEKGKYFKSYGILVTKTSLTESDGLRDNQSIVAVSNIIDGGPAAHEGSLLPGDLVLEVNGHGVLQSSDKAVRSLVDSRATLELVVARPKDRFIPPPCQHETPLNTYC